MPQAPLEAYAFDACLAKWSVFILDSRLYCGKFVKRKSVLHLLKEITLQLGMEV